MAILDFELVQFTGEFNLDGSTKTYEYWVTAEAGDDVDSIHAGAAAAGLPVEGDYFGDTAGLIVLKCVIKQKDNSDNTNRIFDYTVTYGNPPAIDWEENPLSRPADIRGDGSSREEVVFEDSEGTPYRNSAKQLYTGIPPRRVLGGSFIITRNESANPANNAFLYSGSVNNATWHGVAAEKAMLGNISFQKEYHPVYGAYYQVSYPIFLNRNGWRMKVVDAGYSILVGGVPVEILDENGSKLSKEVPLNGSGGILSPASALVYHPTNGFLQQDKTNWGTLALPDPFA